MFMSMIKFVCETGKHEFSTADYRVVDGCPMYAVATCPECGDEVLHCPKGYHDE